MTDTETRTIFLVSEGSYSDYSVCGVFSSRANAEEFMARVGGEFFYADWNEIEEQPLDPALPQLRAGLAPWSVLMLRDGTTERVERQDISPYIAGSTGRNARIWERTKAEAYRGKNVPDALQTTVFASSAEHAVKIANEQRTQMIAEGKWS